MEMTSLEQQILHNRLWSAVLDIDLQLYKGSVYKLRWGSPGVGLDVAVPCYQEAQRTAELTTSPSASPSTSAPWRRATSPRRAGSTAG
jgi:hypothetical protein